MKARPMSPLDLAAYLLDRADQYELDSPCWVALSDAASNVANGEVTEAIMHGELDDPSLRARVKSMAGHGAKKVDPKLGVEP